MDADLDTLATALYVRTDDLLKASPDRAPWRPRVGIAPKISDAELITLGGDAGPARSHQRGPLAALRPRPPAASVPLPAPAVRLQQAAAALAADDRLAGPGPGPRHHACGPTTSGWSTRPRSSARRSRETVQRSDLAGWAEYGYCASHSRFFWGLRLHLVCTLHGLPVGFALTGAKADERHALLAILDTDPALTGRRPSRPDPDRGQELLRPRVRSRACRRRVRTCCARPARASRPGPAARSSSRCGRSSSRSTTPFKGQLDLEAHGGHTPAGVVGPRRATHPRPHRRHLAQRPHRPADQAITTGLRPLTPLGIVHLGLGRAPGLPDSGLAT